MKMTPTFLLVGLVTLFAAITLGVVYLPIATRDDNQPSDIWREMSPDEAAGRQLYIANGCTYCHSQFIRPQDWGIGAERIAQPGDYYHLRTHLLGSERTGPDLSQEGGEHSDDWNYAHFINPRFTSPRSVMPQLRFLGEHNLNQLIAYVQSLGGKDADGRVARQRYWRQYSSQAYAAGPEVNVPWIHSIVPEEWRRMPNPYPATPASVARGERIYQDYCVGCHGPVGDGQGPAATYLYPKPFNFTTLRRHLVQGQYIGGILYYQIMNGVTGTAMPYWKKHLESNKIWDVSNFIAWRFIGYTDAQADRYNPDRAGIPAAYEALQPGELGVR